MNEPFRVGYTWDFLKSDGSIGWGDIGMAQYEGIPNLEVEFMPAATTVTSEAIAGYDALAVLAPRIPAELLDNASRLALVARFGVGYDTVDIDAATRNGIAVTITPNGVRRPMAAMALTMILALSHRIIEKDRITRNGEWSRKLDYMGYQVTGKTLGVIGLGNIGRELLTLIAPFGMRVLAYDPYVSSSQAAASGAELATLDQVLAESDYVVILSKLTDETYHLIDAKRLAQMKPGAFLISIARGPIVDEPALVEALKNGTIRGAGIDVFEKEPPDPDNPLFALDNVIVAPHALCWTEESAMGIGSSVIESVLAVREGNVPPGLVNPEVADSPKFQQKLADLKARMEG